MSTRWFSGKRGGFATARYAMVAFGIAVAIGSLGADSVSAQSRQEYKAAKEAPKPWPPARLPDGQPDVQGLFDVVGGATSSLENPVPQGYQDPNAPPPVRPSRVVDPPDGRVPYQPWAAALRERQGKVWGNPTKPEHFDSQHRCLTSPPRLYYFVRWYKITQAPGLVMMTWDGPFHTYRIIPVDGTPHIGPNIKLWMGNPRGHWEGNTLVVETTNFNGKSRLTVPGDFVTSKARLVERFIFVDATTMTYEATIDDPTVFTRPWTIRVPQKRRATNDEIWEEACHEGELGVLLEEREGTLPR